MDEEQLRNFMETTSAELLATRQLVEKKRNQLEEIQSRNAKEVERLKEEISSMRQNLQVRKDLMEKRKREYESRAIEARNKALLITTGIVGFPIRQEVSVQYGEDRSAI
jgi:wobble nucleotide-excising tRNase